MRETLANPSLLPVWATGNPDLALALLFLGIIGIYAEFSAPGMVAPGVIGSVLGLVGIAALAAFPIDWRGAALIVLAFAFFVLEAKYVSYGVLTAAGAGAMIAGSVLLIASPEHRIHITTAAAIAVPFALISSFLFSLAVRARRNKVVTGIDRMVGLTGVAVNELNPAGTIMIRGEYWKAVAPCRVEAARRVRVTSVKGLTLQVEPVREEIQPS